MKQVIILCILVIFASQGFCLNSDNEMRYLEKMIPKLPFKSLRRLIERFQLYHRIEDNEDGLKEQIEEKVNELVKSSEQAEQAIKLGFTYFKQKEEENESLQENNWISRQKNLYRNYLVNLKEIKAETKEFNKSLNELWAVRQLFYDNSNNRTLAGKHFILMLKSQMKNNRNLKKSHLSFIRKAIKHAGQVITSTAFIGTPGTDLTSAALYDPNNNVFTKHPEQLKHSQVSSRFSHFLSHSLEHPVADTESTQDGEANTENTQNEQANSEEKVPSTNELIDSGAIVAKSLTDFAKKFYAFTSDEVKTLAQSANKAYKDNLPAIQKWSEILNKKILEDKEYIEQELSKNADNETE